MGRVLGEAYISILFLAWKSPQTSKTRNVIFAKKKKKSSQKQEVKTVTLGSQITGYTYHLLMYILIFNVSCISSTNCEIQETISPLIHFFIPTEDTEVLSG